MLLGHGRPPAVLMLGTTKVAAAPVRPPSASRRSEKNLFSWSPRACDT